ncbi:MAG: hypothetical protein HJJLKODD_00228 [Phycisphaerae bacterium]|nr:hypothetical protein [Phycisphaerae bacterium]
MAPQSLQIMLGGIIDYAGLFPPAQEMMNEALKKYAAFQRSEHGWMVSRFICPASRLAELGKYSDLVFGDGSAPWQISAIGRGGADINEFLAGLQSDKKDIQHFLEEYGEHAQVDMYEAKIPPVVVAQAEAGVWELVERAAELIVTAEKGMAPFYEIGFENGDPALVAGALRGMQQFNRKWAGVRHRAVGAKIRTGGLQPEMIPTPRQVAFFITACERLGLCFKATAGLHHPYRHEDRQLGAWCHGFVNVFFASMAAFAGYRELPLLIEILECSSPEAFVFGDQSIRWYDINIPVEKVLETRRMLALSFGSCSLEEPVTDLNALGLFNS